MAARKFAFSRFLAFSCALVVLLFAAGGLQAADKTDKDDAAKDADAQPAAEKSTTPNAADAGANFEKTFSDWRHLLGQLRALRAKIQDPAAAKPLELRAEYKKLIEQGQKMAPLVGIAAEQAYTTDPKKYADAGDFLLNRVGDNLQQDQYEEATRLAKLLIDHGYDKGMLYLMAGKAALNSNHFDDAIKYSKKAIAMGAPGSQATEMLQRAEKEKGLWAKEQAIRAAEKKADDLPRVKIKTSQGDIVVELFENEAPNTVASFLDLVEKKYYDGSKFHRVLPEFMAQTGRPKGTDAESPGFTIADECNQPNHRNHFRGSLSTAHTSAPDSNGSQFFLTFVPTDSLDGKYTVFGRIIDGMDVLSKITRIDPQSPEGQASPDTIESATVLRKRDHEYKPVRVKDR